MTQLRAILRAAGGNPDSVAPRVAVPIDPLTVPTDARRAAFDAMARKFGKRLYDTPAKYVRKPTAAEIREGMGDYLNEVLGGRPGGFDSAGHVDGLARQDHFAILQRGGSFKREGTDQSNLNKK